jgi:hypothetical protein
MKQRLEDLFAPTRNMLHSNYFEEAQLFNLLPVAVSVCDASGILVNFNRKATELWGRKPKVGDRDERFCGSSRLYEPGGMAVSHNESPVALCLADGLVRKNVQMIIERPDLAKVLVQMDVSPIFDEEGNLLGVINCFSELKYQVPADTGKEKLLQILKEGENQFYRLFQDLQTP